MTSSPFSTVYRTTSLPRPDGRQSIVLPFVGYRVCYICYHCIALMIWRRWRRDDDDDMMMTMMMMTMTILFTVTSPHSNAPSGHLPHWLMPGGKWRNGRTSDYSDRTTLLLIAARKEHLIKRQICIHLLSVPSAIVSEIFMRFNRILTKLCRLKLRSSNYASPCSRWRRPTTSVCALGSRDTSWLLVLRHLARF